MDKLSHNLALICKKLYLHKLHKEIHSDAYATALEDRSIILSRHKIFNSKYNYKNVDNLPYLYGVPKMHKNPKSLRMIAGGGGEGVGYGICIAFTFVAVIIIVMYCSFSLFF